MSMNQPGPSLEQYPGFFPAAKPPFWTRTKVGIAAVVCGLLVGVGGAAAGDAGDKENAPKADTGITQAEVDDAVDEAVDKAVDDATGELKEQLSDQKADASKQVKAADRALASYKKKAAAARKRAVDEAVAAERARVEAAAPPVQQFVNTPEATDPQFGTCGEANDNGYGEYHSGVDPEYDWYDDRDNDGVVCEF